MSTKLLKRLLRKDPEVQDFLSRVSDLTEVSLCIISEQGALLYGDKDTHAKGLPHQGALRDEQSEYAYVLSDDDRAARMIADLLSIFIKKEADKKQIGSEVLGLYREINLIYNFSEQISEKIDIESIGATALEQATQIIDATHAIALIHDQETDEVREIASHGKNPNQERNITDFNDRLKKFVTRGRSEIFSAEQLAITQTMNHLKALMIAPLKVKDRHLGMIMVGHKEDREYTAAELKLLTTIALQSASAVDSAILFQKGLRAVQEREEAVRKINDISLKFVPNQFLKSLGKSSLTEVKLGEQVKKEVTVMFLDIRDFTSISEGMDPSENFKLINEFNNLMGPIIRDHGGFIMQYLGDGFMAIFPGSAQDAVDASVEMHRALTTFDATEHINDQSEVQMGIGMHRGPLIMGITGDRARLDAAIISDTVNTASRIEGLSKHYGSNILITGDCYTNLHLDQRHHFRYLGKVKVKGKQIAMDLYECFDGDPTDLLEHKLKTRDQFSEGLELYLNREFAMAAVTFQNIVKMNGDDRPARHFLNRSARLITENLKEDWAGVEMFGKM